MSSLPFEGQQADIGRDMLFWWMAEGDCIAVVCGRRQGQSGVLL